MLILIHVAAVGKRVCSYPNPNFNPDWPAHFLTAAFHLVFFLPGCELKPMLFVLTTPDNSMNTNPLPTSMSSYTRRASFKVRTHGTNCFQFVLITTSRALRATMTCPTTQYTIPFLPHPAAKLTLSPTSDNLPHKRKQDLTVRPSHVLYQAYTHTSTLLGSNKANVPDLATGSLGATSSAPGDRPMLAW